MALKTIAQLKTSISGLLQGADLDNVTNLNGAIERAARVFLQKAGVPEAMGKQSIVLYDGVTDYLAPSTIYGTSLIDVQPQGTVRDTSDVVYKEGIEVFDRNKGLLGNGTAVSFQFVNGVSVMRIVSSQASKSIALDTLGATTGWTLAGSGTGLTEDDGVFYQNSSSLRFLLTGSSTGTLTKTLTNSLDLSKYEDIGVVFLAIRIPDGATASNLTSVTLKLGSSATAYDSVTATQGNLGAWVSGDWLLVPFDMSTSVSTGVPDWSAINYIQISIAHTGTFTNFRVGGLFASLPYPSNLIFRSAAIFQASGANPSQSITTDSDTVNLKDDAYAIYEHECAYTIAQQSGGRYSGTILAQFASLLNGARTRTGAVINLGLYDLYRAKNPDESLLTTGSYYD